MAKRTPYATAERDPKPKLKRPNRHAKKPNKRTKVKTFFG